MIAFLNDDFDYLNEFIADSKSTKIFILVDENTHEHCLPVLLANLKTEISYEIIEIEAGEEMKTIETATELWEILSDFQADRNALLINLGGGVITDLGGFVASTYKRGIRFIHIPTSPLAMCDASIGGKTGIDLQFKKNMVGTFAMPEHIFVYTDFLKTLPFIELRSGFAEMLKHGLIADATHWKDLINMKELNVENISPFIPKSMEIKQDFVEKDFKEQNIRKALNFGHTFGHALESLYLKAGKTIPHGEAVAMGIIAEGFLSYKKLHLQQKEWEEILSNMLRFYPFHSISGFQNHEVINLMLSDKKNNLGNINFSLIPKIGASEVNCICSENEIFDMLDYFKTI